MKKMMLGMLVLSALVSCFGANEFTKPRKEKKVSDAQIREQCCRDLGDSVKSCIALTKDLAGIEEHGLNIVEDIINGASACPLVGKKGAELSAVATQVAHYKERLCEIEKELDGYQQLLKNVQRAH